MRHPDDGALRAYLDHELDRLTAQRVEAHVRSCPRCERTLDDLRGIQTRVALRIDELRAPPAAERSPRQALVAFRARTAGLQPAHRSDARSNDKMWRRITTGRWRVAWAAMVAALAITFVCAYAPARTLASQALGVFRVRKFAVISLSASTVENLNLLDAAEQLLSEQVEVIKGPGPSTPAGSAAEASALAGFDVRLPSRLPAAFQGEPTLLVGDTAHVQARVKLDRVRAILDAMGRSDLALPKALDGAVLDLNVPHIVTALWLGGAGASPLTLIQAPSPDVELPAGVDLADLGAIALQLAGLPKAEAVELAARIDWANTLVIPLPQSAATYRDVTVAGAQGLLIQGSPSNQGDQYLLLWQRDGIVYGFQSQTSWSFLIEAAESMW